MIDGVILVPDTDRIVLYATLVGDLANILNICAKVSGKSKLPSIAATESQLSVVAGARFELATFRLSEI